MIKILIVILAALTLKAQAVEDRVFREKVQPFLDKHCFSCHGAKKQKGNIRYDQIKGFDVDDHHLWTLIYEQVSSGEMPPEKKPQPTKQEKEIVFNWIKDKSKAASTNQSTGYIRRLNRRELSAYLHDLTGLKLDSSLGLPQDGKVNGFDTGVEGLQDSSIALVEILKITRFAIDGLRFLEPSKSQLLSFDFKSLKKPFDTLNGKVSAAGGYVKFRDQGDANVTGQGVLLSGYWAGERRVSNITIPVSEKGLYRIKGLFSKYQSNYKGLPEVTGYLGVRGLNSKKISVTGTVDSPQAIEVVGNLEHTILQQTSAKSISEAKKKNRPYSEQMLKISFGSRIDMPYAVNGFVNENKGGAPGDFTFRPYIGSDASRVESLSFSPDGRFATCAGSSRGFQVWDVANSRPIQDLRQHKRTVHSAAFSSDGKFIVSGSTDNNIIIWDATKYMNIKLIKGHKKPVRSVSFSPDGKSIVSGSDDQTVRLWDAKSGKELKLFKGHEQSVRSVSFSPDGKSIVSGSDDQTLILWDVKSGKKLKLFKGHEQSVRSVSFSPDGKSIASAGNDGIVRIWDVRSGKLLKSLKGHTKTIRAVSFSPNGTLLASAGEDKMLKVWDVKTGAEIKSMIDRQILWSLCFHPDGKKIATAGKDKGVRFWDISTGKVVKGLFKPGFSHRPIPHAVLQGLEVETNYTKQWPPAEWQVSVGKPADNDEYATALISLWMKKAFRRDISKSELSHFKIFYKSLRAQGLSFDDAVKATFHSVLMSAPSRYLTAPEGSSRLDHFAIASKLSFMLTGRAPDQALLDSAAAGKLQNTAVLHAHIDRLLDSSDSYGFYKPFVYQWLHMDQPITLASKYFGQPDHYFNLKLIDSMREETILYFAQMVKENSPASEIIHSDWTMMDKSLARHYKYEDVTSPEFKKIKLKKNDPRGGGIIGQAGIQAMLTWMGEHWIIYRGHWMLKHILDDPPPAPPLEVPELEPSKHKNKSIREILKTHTEAENCYVCHRKIDPMGFAFRNFDPNGSWRDLEFETYATKELDGKKEWRGVGKSKPLDVSATLHKGGSFKSYKEFKELIIKHYMDDVAMGLMKNFVLYGTGRKPVVEDILKLEKLQASLKKKNYPMRDLLKAVITSSIFIGESRE